MENTSAPTVRLHVILAVSFVPKGAAEYVKHICAGCGHFREVTEGFVRDGKVFRMSIKFGMAASSSRARSLLDGVKIPGFISLSPMKVIYSEMTRNLWVGNVHESVTERILRDRCESASGILPETVQIKNKYAFLSFRSVEDAAQALEGLQALTLPPNSGWALAVDFDNRYEERNDVSGRGSSSAIRRVNNFNNKREEIENVFRKETHKHVSQRGRYSPPQRENREFLNERRINRSKINENGQYIASSPYTDNRTTARNSDLPQYKEDSDIPNRSPSKSRPERLQSPDRVLRSSSSGQSKRYRSPDNSNQQASSPTGKPRNSPSQEIAKSPERQTRSRSPTPSRNRSQSRSPTPSRNHLRSRSRTPPRKSPTLTTSRNRSPSRSPIPSGNRSRSRSPTPTPNRSRSRSPTPSRHLSRSRSRTPPRKSPTLTTSRYRSPSRSRYESKSKSRSRSPVKNRSRSNSRSPSGEHSKQSRIRSNSHSRSRSRSSSPRKRYRSSLDSVFADQMKRMQKTLDMLTEKMSSQPPQVRTPRPKPSATTLSNHNTPEKQSPCPECANMISLFRQHVESSHTSLEDDVIKDWIKLWFSSRFERAIGSDPAITTVSYTKLKFLKEELNVFLTSMGLEEWNSNSNLYRNWFLPDILGQNVEGAKSKLIFRMKLSNEEIKNRILELAN